jgi:hypothetical protein
MQYVTMNQLVNLFQEYCDNEQMEVGASEEGMFNDINRKYTENWMKENELELIPYSHVLVDVRGLPAFIQMKPETIAAQLAKRGGAYPVSLRQIIEKAVRFGVEAGAKEPEKLEERIKTYVNRNS